MSQEISGSSLAAEVLFMPERPVGEDAINNALTETMTSLGYNVEEIRDCLRGKTDDAQVPQRLLLEASVDVDTVLEAIEGKTDNANTLNDWHQYCSLMRRHGVKGDGSASALMIGAAASVSARSFACLARSEYGADPGRTFVIDPMVTQPKAKQATLLQANGTALPVLSGTIDFVHTNELLQHLKDSSRPKETHKATRARLFREIGRVLSPGGQLLMKEKAPGIRSDATPKKQRERRDMFARQIVALLEDCGMRAVAKGSWVPETSDFLFDNERSSNVKRHPLSSSMIYARKL